VVCVASILHACVPMHGHLMKPNKRMSIKTAYLLCAVLTLVRCQLYPRFEFKNRTLINNSYVFRGDVREGNDALKCVTDNADCCTDPDVGNWTDETGGAVHQGASGATTIYVTRGDGVVSLNRIRGGTAGMWRCDILDSSGVMQSIYIYTGTDRAGELSYSFQFVLQVCNCTFLVLTSPIRPTDLSNHLLHCPPR